MSPQALLQVLALAALLAILAPPLGAYIARVFMPESPDPEGEPLPSAWGDPVFRRIEAPVYRLCRIDPAAGQSWSSYAISFIAFSGVSVLALYLLLRTQGSLPLNPTDRPDVPGPIAFNTAISFMTNTNWQTYSGEMTMSHLSQMMGLTVQNFVSAGAGIAVAAALIRGLLRRRRDDVGNFWVDLIRANVRLLLPLSLLFAVVFVALGVIQNLGGFQEYGGGVIPGGPVASQIAIKQLGSNGGGFFNANAAHPFENPDGLTNLLETLLILLLPLALVAGFGRMARDRRQGWALAGVMIALWFVPTVLGTVAEAGGNPALEPAGVEQAAEAGLAGGGNLEGKELRFGTDASMLWAGSTTGTSNGSVNSAHDSLTPLGGLVPIGEMMLGEVSPGGVGVGLMGMLIYAILAVFIVGLMVGRTPEYLGKKVGPPQMKLVSLYLLAMPVTVLTLAAVSVAVPSLTDSIAAPGPHGFSEVLYAFLSGTNNNGSAFGGISSADDWYAITVGVAMMLGRFALIVPALAIAGSLGRQGVAARTVATLPTGSPTFAAVLFGTVLVVSGLVFFPALALGPVTEAIEIGDLGGAR